MESATTAAIVIPVYNRAGSVVRALDSVASQTEPPFALTIVDDGSTDASADSVREWQRRQSGAWRFQLISQENRGASAARNRGLREVPQTDYLVFLDSDDSLPHDFLTRSRRALDADPNAVAVSCDQCFVDSNSGLQRLRNLQGLSNDATRWLIEHDGGINSSTMLRRQLVDCCGGFDERLPVAEDLKFYLQLSLLGPWLHTRGTPSLISRGESANPSESGRLSNLGPQARLHTAQVLEEFLMAHDRSLLRAALRSKVAQIWYQAGRDFVRSGDIARGRTCLCKCHEWDRWHMKAWWQRLRTKLAGKAQR